MAKAETKQYKSGSIVKLDPKVCVISPLNSRKIQVTDERIAELAESISTQGQLQPALGRPLDKGKFEILAGGNRLRAVMLLNEMKPDNEEPFLLAVQVVTGDDKSSLLKSVAENEFRTAPTIVDRAYEMSRMVEELNMSQKEVANFFHTSEATVTQTMKVLKLNQKVQKAIASGEVPGDVARILANVPKDQQADILDDAIKYHSWQEETIGEIEAAEEAEAEEQEAAAAAAGDGEESEGTSKKKKTTDKRKSGAKVGKKGTKATVEDVKKVMKDKGLSKEEDGKAKSRKQFLEILEAMDTTAQSNAARRLMRALAEWMEGGRSDADLEKSFSRAMPKEERDAA